MIYILTNPILSLLTGIVCIQRLIQLNIFVPQNYISFKNIKQQSHVTGSNMYFFIMMKI